MSGAVADVLVDTDIEAHGRIAALRFKYLHLVIANELTDRAG